MDTTKNRQRITREQATGTLDLYAGRAMHGDSPPAIDRTAVLESWRTIWRAVLVNLTPIQLRALREEIEEVDG